MFLLNEARDQGAIWKEGAQGVALDLALALAAIPSDDIATRSMRTQVRESILGGVGHEVEVEVEVWFQDLLVLLDRSTSLVCTYNGNRSIAIDHYILDDNAKLCGELRLVCTAGGCFLN